MGRYLVRWFVDLFFASALITGLLIFAAMVLA